MPLPGVLTCQTYRGLEMVDKTNFVELIRQNIGAFLFGFIVGSGAWPMLWDALTNI